MLATSKLRCHGTHMVLASSKGSKGSRVQISNTYPLASMSQQHELRGIFFFSLNNIRDLCWRAHGRKKATLANLYARSTNTISGWTCPGHDTTHKQGSMIRPQTNSACLCSDLARDGSQLGLHPCPISSHASQTNRLLHTAHKSQCSSDD